LSFLQSLWNDGEVMRYVGYPQGLRIDEQGMQEWFEWLEQHRGIDREHWIIENGRGEPIGEAYYKAEHEYYGYPPAQQVTSPPNRAEKMAQIDIKLARGFWEQGYAADALRALIRYLFEKGFETIVVSPNPANQAALRLYERLGFEPKHRFRSEETRAEHQVWVLQKAGS
jgi:RimJ/RimL family protein N-acetyltransferase